MDANGSTETISQSLRSKVAVVSGSSSGIGAAIAHELSSRGAHVVVNYPFPSLKAQADVVVDGLPTAGIVSLSSPFISSSPVALLSCPLKFVSSKKPCLSPLHSSMFGEVDGRATHI